MLSSLTQKILDRARALGFDAVGIAAADDLEQDDQALSRWLAEGRHAGMAYMAREPHRRSRPPTVLPGAKSVIVLALNYAQDNPPGPGRSTVGRVARYARGRDYHDVIEDRLSQLEVFLRETAGPGTDCRSYVDHGPVLEKAFARQAGIGFVGKNTLLITDSFGSWVFLSVILTTLELEPGTARTSECGSCRACLDACPTGALVAPYQLDANRCISYLTIENKGAIPEALIPKLGGWVFGCDICQEVCPYNARSKPTGVKEFRPEEGVGPWLDLEKLAAIKSDEEFRAAFRDTPLLRPKRAGLQRNAEALLSQR
ncbi:MAG TPA: tRNA epoxyqueuosine(34) reductase QueG [Nitrospiria bacterium]|jgi:epoxyqueuosine reductase|nr:tRNA epoxyqueuosine(34) reductase QueG [Nitrospiria bacterium]